MFLTYLQAKLNIQHVHLSQGNSRKMPHNRLAAVLNTDEGLGHSKEPRSVKSNGERSASFNGHKVDFSGAFLLA